MEKRYSLKETCEAINHCQKRGRMFARFKREFRNNVMCWNPVTATPYVTNQERIMYAPNCLTSSLSLIDI